jgi:hypothetical protein
MVEASSWDILIDPILRREVSRRRLDVKETREVLDGHGSIRLDPS